MKNTACTEKTLLIEDASYTSIRQLKIQIFRATGKIVRYRSDADRPDEELIGAYERILDAALTKGEGPFEGFHDGKLEWDVDDGQGEEDSDPSCGNYALSLVDGRNASLTERGYASLVCDAEDLAALKKLAKLDRRTIRQFFKKIVADELARSMPRSTDTAAEKEGL